MPELRPEILRTPHSGIRRMLELAGEVPSPIMLVNGDPNFGTPRTTSSSRGRGGGAVRPATRRAPASGELREAIADKVGRRNGLAASSENICVTTGACGGLFTSLMLTVGPGRRRARPRPRLVELRSDGPRASEHGPCRTRSARPSAGRSTRRSSSPRSPDGQSSVIVNSPSNPSGVVESPQHLADVVAVAARHDLWVLADEAYDELVFDGSPTSTATVAGSGGEHVISVFSFSKTYAMTGWRVGYVVAAPEFVRQLALHQEPVVSCASTISQHAALAALRGPQDCVARMVDAYRARQRLRRGGARCTRLRLPVAGRSFLHHG